jgi:hypothetical protein
MECQDAEKKCDNYFDRVDCETAMASRRKAQSPKNVVTAHLALDVFAGDIFDELI